MLHRTYAAPSSTNASLLRAQSLRINIDSRIAVNKSIPIQRKRIRNIAMNLIRINKPSKNRAVIPSSHVDKPVVFGQYAISTII